MCRAIDATGRIARSHMWPPHAAATPREGTGPRKDIQKGPREPEKTIRSIFDSKRFQNKRCKYVRRQQCESKPISKMWSAKDIDVSWISQVSHQGRMNPIGIFTSKRFCFKQNSYTNPHDSSGSMISKQGPEENYTTKTPRILTHLRRAEFSSRILSDGSFFVRLW